MTEYQYLDFVGIFEHIQDTPLYDYCVLNTKTGGMSGQASVRGLGEIIAYQYGENFRQKITYEPPQGIDERGTERGLCPRKYHRLSILEQDRFEKSVLSTLQDKGKKEQIYLMKRYKSVLNILQGKE